MCGQNLAVARWVLPIVDVYGTEFPIPFYICEGNGPLLLGNSVIGTSDLLGREHMLVFPANCVQPGSPEIHLPTYMNGEASLLRTHLHVVPSISKHISSFFSSVSLLSEVRDGGEKSRYDDKRYARQFAVRLHTFTHFPPRDME